jgi:hypothetical protein
MISERVLGGGFPLNNALPARLPARPPARPPARLPTHKHDLAERTPEEGSLTS